MPQQAPSRSFRKGVSLVELFQMFPDDESAERRFESRIWKDGRKCSHCGSAESEKEPRPIMRYGCAECHKYFSVKVGTVAESSKIPYQKWAIAAYQFAANLRGVSSMKTRRDLGITQKSAWFMVHRLRESWKTLAGV